MKDILDIAAWSALALLAAALLTPSANPEPPAPAPALTAATCPDCVELRKQLTQIEADSDQFQRALDSAETTVRGLIAEVTTLKDAALTADDLQQAEARLADTVAASQQRVDARIEAAEDKVAMLEKADAEVRTIEETTQPALADLKWFTSGPEANAEAKRTGKPLLVRWTAVWCGPCQRKTETVFSDPDVASYLAANFVCFEADCDKFSDRVKDQWGVPPIPAEFVADAGGREAVTSTNDADRFITAVMEATSKLRRKEKSVLKQTTQPDQYYQPVYYEPMPTYGRGYSSGSFPTYGGMMGGGCSSGNCGGW